jgi:MFS family permease
MAMPTSPSAVPPVLRNSESNPSVAPSEIAVGVVIGRSSEYFDFFVYGIASVLVFPAAFFPYLSPLEGQLMSFALVALAFCVRPIGTLAGMEIQRRWGRGAKLTVALMMLGTSTVGIGILPVHTEATPWAGLLLALLRIGQGLALGGSWDGLPSLLALNAPRHKRGWYAMLGQLGAPLGLLVAAGLYAYLWFTISPEEFITWGWRYPFFAAFAINVVALFARLRLVVTHEYDRELQARELEPCKPAELLREQGSNLLLGAFAPLASYALFHLVTFFPLSWILLEGGRPIGPLLVVEVIAALLCAAAMPISGWLSDRYSRLRLLGSLSIAIGVWSLAAPFLLERSIAGQNVFILSGAILLGLSYAQAAGPLTSNFLPRFRYTGAALSTDLAWLFGAAFAPLVVLWLSERFGLVSVTFYLLSGVIVTMLTLLFNRARRRAATSAAGKH